MHKYYVKSAEQITPSTLLLTLEKDPDENRLFSFQPGQYVAISFKRHHRPSVARCFSIVSSPTEQTRLQFSMRTRGKYTSALTTLQPGDEVLVRGPFGGFVFDVKRDTHAVFAAGGIGITPFMSMMQYATAISLHNEIILLYGVPSQDDIPFFDDLNALQLRNPKLKIVYVVGNGPIDKLAGYTCETGFVNDQTFERYAANYVEATYFVCGPPPFMRGILKTLRTKGVPRNKLITEAFSQGPNRQTGRVASWPQNIYVMGGVGLALTTLTVMVTDVIKSLPQTPFVSGENALELVSDPNQREEDLDGMVNELPNLSEKKGASVAVVNALKKSKASTAPSKPLSPTYYSSSPTTPQTTTGSTSRPATSSGSATPTPVPTPKPVCTTSQSGVTTCN